MALTVSKKAPASPVDALSIHSLRYGASLRILDTNTPTGRLLLNLVGNVAQFEREVMLERQRERIVKAKEEGKYKGRVMTARAKSDDVLSLHKAGKGASEIADQLGIGRASVYRIRNDMKDQWQ